MDSDPLTISTELVEGSALVTVVGDVDLSSADHFRAELEAALTQASTVVVELSHLSFIDSSGLNALVRAHQAAQRCGSQLRLRHLRPMLLQLLHITHLETVFVVDEHECDIEAGCPDRAS